MMNDLSDGIIRSMITLTPNQQKYRRNVTLILNVRCTVGREHVAVDGCVIESGCKAEWINANDKKEMMREEK